MTVETGGIGTAGQALVRFALLPPADEALNLDHLLHVLLVELASSQRSGCRTIRPRAKACSSTIDMFVLFDLSELQSRSAFASRTCRELCTLELHDLWFLGVEFTKDVVGALPLNESTTG